MCNFVGIPPSIFVDFSLIYIDLINIHITEIANILYISLYGYRTVSQLSFDTNYSSLGLSGAKKHVIFYVYCLNFSVILLYHRFERFCSYL